MRLVRRDEPEGDDRLGPVIDGWFLDRPLGRSLRGDAKWLRQLLDAADPGGQTPRKVADLGSGSADGLLRELARRPDSPWTATCVDLDADALVEGSRQARALGLADRACFVQADVVPVAGAAPSFGRHDLVVSCGLCSTPPGDAFVALLDLGHDSFRPGGRTAVTQFAAGYADELLVRHLLDWQTTARTAAEIEALFGRSRFGRADLTLSLDKAGVLWMAETVKPS